MKLIKFLFLILSLVFLKKFYKTKKTKGPKTLKNGIPIPERKNINF